MDFSRLHSGLHEFNDIWGLVCLIRQILTRTFDVGSHSLCCLNGLLMHI